MRHNGILHRRQVGFATSTAIILLSVVGMALLAMTLLFQDDSQRTSHHRAETQLRQLLIAGARAAVQAVKDQPEVPGDRSIPLPEALNGAELRIACASAGPGSFTATITTRLEDTQASQVLTFTRSSSGWMLQGAELTRQH